MQKIWFRGRRYLQKPKSRQKPISKNNLQPPSLLDSINKTANSNKCLSKLYKYLYSTDSTKPLPINKWGKYLTTGPVMTSGLKNVKSIFNMPMNTNTRRTQYKVFDVTNERNRIKGNGHCSVFLVYFI